MIQTENSIIITGLAEVVFTFISMENWYESLQLGKFGSPKPTSHFIGIIHIALSDTVVSNLPDY